MRRLTAPPERGHAGFTLVEVMVAVAVLALALTVISESQQAGMRHVLRAKKMTIATLLAREKMVELEDEVFEEGFSEFEKEEEGEFEDGPAGFSYRWKVEKIELPAALDPEAMSDALTGGAEDEGQSASGGMAAFGGELLSRQFEMFRSILEQSIRRASLEVIWKEGRAAKSLTLTSYFTDPRRVDNAMRPGPAIPGMGGGLPAGAASPPGSGSSAAGGGQ